MCAFLCDSYLIVKDSLLTQIMPTPPWDPIIFFTWTAAALPTVQKHWGILQLASF